MIWQFTLVPECFMYYNVSNYNKKIIIVYKKAVICLGNRILFNTIYLKQNVQGELRPKSNRVKGKKDGHR